MTRERKRRLKHQAGRAFRFLVALAVTVVFLFPVYWLFATSFKTPNEIYAYPPAWVPERLRFDNYAQIFRDQEVRALWNSLGLAAASTVAAMLIGMVESLGYQTISAVDGPSALEALGRVGKVDLLFTDVVLPRGMNGAALAKAAQQRQPGLRVLYMSGYTRNAILHNGALDEGVQLITKPFRKADLAGKLREVLSG